MKSRRTDRLNSLLKEVISEVISRSVKNPQLNGKLISVSRVEITRDLQHAKVFISVIGDESDKEVVLQAIKSAAGFIAVRASKKVVMRHFPSLTFHLDSTVEKQARISDLLTEVEQERNNRASNPQAESNNG